VLLYELLEDLFCERTPRTVCFCAGDAPYKRFFANASVETADILLLRRDVGNRLLLATHACFRSAVKCVKRLRARLEGNSPTLGDCQAARPAR
jgi:hypothetical protein